MMADRETEEGLSSLLRSLSRRGRGLGAICLKFDPTKPRHFQWEASVEDNREGSLRRGGLLRSRAATAEMAVYHLVISVYRWSPKR